jgi:hypothetical protein
LRQLKSTNKLITQIVPLLKTPLYHHQKRYNILTKVHLLPHLRYPPLPFDPTNKTSTLSISTRNNNNFSYKQTAKHQSRPPTTYPTTKVTSSLLLTPSLLFSQPNNSPLSLDTHPFIFKKKPPPTVTKSRYPIGIPS